jgi:hypothetical protein
MAAGSRPTTAEPAAPIPDEELVARVLAGDQESFSLLVERYQDRLVSFLFRMLRDLDTAHDLSQEVFLRVYQALDRFDPQFKFSTWTFSCRGAGRARTRTCATSSAAGRSSAPSTPFPATTAS